MRDPARIDPFCCRLSEAWQKLPDWRFGQFMMNVLGEMSATGRDPFFPEDDSMLEYIERYAEKHAPKKSREWSSVGFDRKTGTYYQVSRPVGQSAKVRVRVGGFVGVASCNPGDKFNLRTGIELACARAKFKYLRYKREMLEKESGEALRKENEAHGEINAIMNRIYHKEYFV